MDTLGPLLLQEVQAPETVHERLNAIREAAEGIAESEKLNVLHKVCVSLGIALEQGREALYMQALSILAQSTGRTAPLDTLEILEQARAHINRHKENINPTFAETPPQNQSELPTIAIEPGRIATLILETVPHIEQSHPLEALHALRQAFQDCKGENFTLNQGDWEEKEYVAYPETLRSVVEMATKIAKAQLDVKPPTADLNKVRQAISVMATVLSGSEEPETQALHQLAVKTVKEIDERGSEISLSYGLTRMSAIEQASLRMRILSLCTAAKIQKTDSDRLQNILDAAFRNGVGAVTNFTDVLKKLEAGATMEGVEVTLITMEFLWGIRNMGEGRGGRQ